MSLPKRHRTYRPRGMVFGPSLGTPPRRHGRPAPPRAKADSFHCHRSSSAHLAAPQSNSRQRPHLMFRSRSRQPAPQVRQLRHRGVPQGLARRRLIDATRPHREAAAPPVATASVHHPHGACARPLRPGLTDARAMRRGRLTTPRCTPNPPTLRWPRSGRWAAGHTSPRCTAPAARSQVQTASAPDFR